jgi:fermentation-respiration switch protein FrsA (DUF1100 family)
MKKALKYILLLPLALAASLYLTAGVALYVSQRGIIYQPSTTIVAPPPAGSIYSARNIAPEGGRLVVWTAPPARADLPTIFFFHGNASDVSDFAQFGEIFHRQGWGVVLADYRGYAGNSGKPSEQGLFDDARALLAAIHPSGPVLLWGHSLGTGVAAQLASEGLGDALVLEAPFTSLAEVGAELYPLFPVEWLLTDRFDTASLVPTIDMPVLIFHGTIDPIVPFALGQKLAESFGARAAFVPMENVGHIPHQHDLSGVVFRWFEKR